MPLSGGAGGGGEVSGEVSISNSPLPVSVAAQPNFALVTHTTFTEQIFTSSAKTTEQIFEFTNEYWRGVLLTVNVTVDPATADVTPHLEYYNPITAAYVPYWTAAAAISATGNFRYLIHPGAFSETEPTNITEIFPWPLPRNCQWRFAVADGDSLTWSAFHTFFI